MYAANGTPTDVTDLLDIRKVQLRVCWSQGHT